MEYSQKKKLAGAAIIVMASTILSRIVGYVREMLIPAKLGVNNVADAYNAAFYVPDLMYFMLLGGSIAAALIPVLTGYIERKEEEEGWKAVSTFINVTFISMIIICVLGMVFAPQIIPLVAEGLASRNEETRLLAIKLTRILFPSVTFLMLAGLCNGILNSYNRFASASFGPIIYNIGGILSLAIFGSSTPQGAENVAYGVMISSFVYFVFQLSVSLRSLKYYRFNISLGHPGFKRLFKLAVPSLIASSIVQINLIISARFASYSFDGGITLLNTANRTWQLPLGIFAQSIGVALLPAMSARLAVGDKKEYGNILGKGLKSILFVALPSAVAFIVLREPIIRTLFKFTKNFTEDAVVTTGYILMFFSAALVAQSVIALLGRAFYASNDTKTPLYTGVLAIFINAALSYVFYYNTSLDIAGIALSYSIASTINAVLLMVILSNKIKCINLASISEFFFKTLTASIVMGIPLYFINMYMPSFSDSKIQQVIGLAFEIAFGIAVYLSAVLIMKISEAQYMLNMLQNRAKTLKARLLNKM